MSKLARKISPHDMKPIALEWLDFKSEQLDTWKDESKTAYDFKFKVLDAWSKRSKRNNEYVSVNELFFCDYPLFTLSFYK